MKGMRVPKQSNDSLHKVRLEAGFVQEIWAKGKSEERVQLLHDLGDCAVDHRLLTKLCAEIFQPPNIDFIPIADWERQMKAFLHKVPEELEQRILAEVRTEQGASRIALKELIDDYSFVPVVIKKDRNKSEKVYQVLTTQSAPAIERE
jgi:hypothetical protein